MFDSMLADALSAASTTSFMVMVDSMALGAFSSVEGLGVEIECEKVKVGGQNDHEVILQNRLKYSNIKLSRPLTWQVQLTQQYFRHFTKMRTKGTAVIEAHYMNAVPVGVWNLVGVVPVKWNGPSLNLNVGSSAIAYETLEIAHDGFLSDGFLGL